MYKCDWKTHQSISITDEVNCPVCLETYTVSPSGNPVMLPSCGHTLCRDCITSIHLLGEKDRLCPICRVPYEGMLPAHLPPNYAVMSLLQKLNIKDIKSALEIKPSAPPLINPEENALAKPPRVIPEDMDEPKLLPVNYYHGPLPDPGCTEDKFCTKCEEKMVPWTLQSTCFSCADFPSYTATNMNQSTHIDTEVSSAVYTATNMNQSTHIDSDASSTVYSIISTPTDMEQDTAITAHAPTSFASSSASAILENSEESDQHEENNLLIRNVTN
ncbi:unnamed protein product [Meganyctiphanes norvegica]|uniref:RING-type domain-containing protein n=1 Tax=Meganyctiphanes norvegica TaxID=48144 RepID=A0AAV2QK92_MEGNR